MVIEVEYLLVVSCRSIALLEHVAMNRIIVQGALATTLLSLSCYFSKREGI